MFPPNFATSRPVSLPLPPTTLPRSLRRAQQRAGLYHAASFSTPVCLYMLTRYNAVISKPGGVGRLRNRQRGPILCTYAAIGPCPILEIRWRERERERPASLRKRCVNHAYEKRGVPKKSRFRLLPPLWPPRRRARRRRARYYPRAGRTCISTCVYDVAKASLFSFFVFFFSFLERN